MIITREAEEPTLSSGVEIPVDMGISDDPEDQRMILGVLSDTLYSDKLAAILREYGCNGADANMEAGCGDSPIDVRLPNRMEPTLAIRDFGLGMTEEQVASVFCKLGRSTKRQSNSFTGMLGIGSKSGFAYGDSFMVTSYASGLKTVYNAYRENGVPKLARMHQEPSDAPSGMEIKIPIRVADIEAVRTTAERTYKFFSVPPKISGAHVNLDQTPALRSGKGWRMIDGGRSYVIMGNVGYDLTSVACPTLSEDLRYLIDMGFELKLNIGDVDVAANREGLQYSEKTLKKLESVMMDLVDELALGITDSIRSAPSLWEAKKLYHELYQNRPGYRLRDLGTILGAKITWKGKTVSHSNFRLKVKDTAGVGPDTKPPEVKVFQRSWNQKLNEVGWADAVEARNTTALVINDTGKQAHSGSLALRTLANGRDPAFPTICEWLVVLNFQDPMAEKTYCDEVGLTGAPFIKLSAVIPDQSLVPITPAGYTSRNGPSPHAAKHNAKVVRLKDGTDTHAGLCSGYWDPAVVDLAKGSGVYVPIDRFMIMPRKNATGEMGSLDEIPGSMTQIIKILKAGGVLPKDFTLIGVKVLQLDKVGPKWVSLGEAIRNGIAKLEKKPGFLQRVADHFAVSKHVYLFGKAYTVDAGGTPVKSAFHQYITAFNKMNASEGLEWAVSEDWKIREWSSKWMEKNEVNLPSPSHNLDVLKSAVQTAYPLIDQHVGYDKRYDFNYKNEAEVVDALKTYVKLLRR